MTVTKANLDDFGGKIPAPTNSRGPVVISDNEVSYSEEQPQLFKKKIPENTNNPIEWCELDKGLFSASPKTRAVLPAAVYSVGLSGGRFAFRKQSVNVDELLVMPDSLSFKILAEIKDFLNNESIYKHHNFLHRRGYLFYGPHGSGKSSLVQQILQQIINENGVVLLCQDPGRLEMGLLDLRRAEPDRFIVCLFEDIDALIHEFGEKNILALLDGESQINKVLNIATTNYPEVLDPRIVGRPRRFDQVIRIDWPNDAMRRHYFEHKLNIDKNELDTWVNASDKFSFAACAELVISVKCLEKPFSEAAETIRKLMTAKPNSSSYNTIGSPVGFSAVT